MSNRGWKALEDVGLDEEIRKSIPVDKRAIHLQDGKLNYQYYEKKVKLFFLYQEAF